MPDGKYVISLHWAEFESNIQHEKLVYNLGDDKVANDNLERVFNVSINDCYLEKNFSITNQFGAERVVSINYHLVVSDGKGISIDFETVKVELMLNALQIRKIL